MAVSLLSEAERTFIVHGVQDNLRNDGRGCEDFRYIELETDVVSNASGSARVRLANTDVIVGVKAELGEPQQDRPNEGILEFFVDCSAIATPAFEGRGGEELATDITSILSRAFDNPACLDLKSLSVISRQQCWILYIDVLILEICGNLVDAVSIAVKAALFNTKLPNVTVTATETGEIDLELSDDPYDFKRIDVSSVPCIVTLNKIGHSHVVDATMEEEACCLARLMVGVSEDGRLTGMNKSGSGSLDPDSINDMVESGIRVGKAVHKTLLQKLEEEEKQGYKVTKVGFLR